MKDSQYTPTIGLEVHAELKTQTKMFCGSRNDPHAGEPNMHVCPVCMGHPGTLPTVNREAVRRVLTVGVAVGGNLATYTEFDRKNYFYPDIPKGYQISQYKYPLVSGGVLADVALTRIHLEEDTARSQHEGATSLVDYNRAGVPLMELVTEPVIHDAATAGNFARELQLLLRTLGVSDANMEKGEMRVEANISVSKDGTLGTKVEVKNLNSFRSVEAAIAFEVARQVKALEAGEAVVQETRGWDEGGQKTFSQRKKESSEDYRYFPDPDIPSLDISKIEDFTESRLRENMPKLPNEIRDSFTNLGLTRNHIEPLLGDFRLLRFFLEVTKDRSDDERSFFATAANYLVSDVAGLLASRGSDVELLPSAAPSYAELVEMLEAKKITSRVAKDLLPEVVFEGKSPAAMAVERSLLQDQSGAALEGVVNEIIAENPTQVAEYASGKESVIEYLVGQGMKKTRGRSDPAQLRDALAQRLRS